MANEFAIIEQYFSGVGPPSAHTVLGIGDDAAVVDVPAGQQLVVAMDTLVAGVHFPEKTGPADIAHKALAVNLSDLAAMGATPAWFQMSLTLSETDSRWLTRFSNGLKQTADSFGVQLVGGDTCRGPLSISIQIAGLVPAGKYLTRSGSSPGDIILVSGELGNAALGLAHVRGEIDLPPSLQAKCTHALNRPHPRLELIPFVREFATSAIDISDGLVGDLKHILEASDCGAWIAQIALPVNAWIEQQAAYRFALDSGDDYEICCTVPAAYRAEVEAWNLAHPGCRLTPVGEITESGYYLRLGERQVDLEQRSGYQHFD